MIIKKLIVTLLVLIFISIEIKCQETYVKNDRNVKIKIPNEWINKLMNYNFSTINTSLIKEFKSFIEPSLINSNNSDWNEEYGGVLNPMFVNLCNDTTTELICLIGWNERKPILTVFKKINNNWYLLYYEPYWDFGVYNEVYVINNY